MKLKPPVENEHHAFCTPGCYSQFYLKSCIVCENSLPAGSTARRLICKRAKCKSALRATPNRYKWPPSYPTSQAALNGSESPIKSGLKTAHKGARPWHLVARPELTTSQFHCATVPDGPDCEWKGGEYERIDARNRALLRDHFRKQAAKCLLHNAPVNILGGYRFPDAPAIELKSPAPNVAHAHHLPDDLSIPDFLRRAA